jgi:hypothetical protein
MCHLTTAPVPAPGASTSDTQVDTVATVATVATVPVVTLAAVTAEAAADMADKSPGVDARLGQCSGMTPEGLRAGEVRHALASH